LWAIALAALCVGVWKPGWVNLLGLAITLACLFGLEGIAQRTGRGESEETAERLAGLAAAPEPAPALEVRRVARAERLAAGPRCADPRSPSSRTRSRSDTRPSRPRAVPMVFVASQGGGIRAAYRTTSVLTALLGSPASKAGDDACPGATTFGRVFAMSGTSGGSLGVTSYAGQPTTKHDWYHDDCGDTDLASVPASWGLLVDLPRTLIGFRGPDRARRFEQAWERQDSTLAADFFTTQPAKPPQDSKPLLLLTGTQVESGCRLNVSPWRRRTSTPNAPPRSRTTSPRAS